MRVWYGTNRRPNTSGGFSNERDSQLHYGRAYVHVPESHEFGSLGTSSAWYWRLFPSLRRDEPLTLEDIEQFSSAGVFYGEMRSKLQSYDIGDRDVLVYIHGYLTSFDDAALRAAQIGYDLKAPLTAFFSWPSRAEPEAYFRDRVTIQASEAYLEEFLTRVLRESGAEEVHVIAHSMGNFGLQRVARNIRDAGLKFGQIFLAAPDVDRDLFVRLAAVYPSISTRATLYVSSKDRALQLSRFLADAARAGYYPPTTVVPSIDTIKVTDIDLTVVGYSYFADAAAVLEDMFTLLPSCVVIWHR